MPYASKAQRGKFHALQAANKISSKVVKEFDQASKGKKLPERVGGKAKKAAAKPGKRGISFA